MDSNSSFMPREKSADQTPPTPNRGLAVVGAAAGAAIGAAIWCAVEYFANIRFGYIAVLVGVFAGLGAVKLGKHQGTEIGVISAIAGLAGVLVGYYLAFVISLHSDRTVSQIADRLRKDPQFAGMADKDIREAAAAGLAEVRKHMTFENYFREDPKSGMYMALFAGLGLYAGFRVGVGKKE